MSTQPCYYSNFSGTSLTNPPTFECKKGFYCPFTTPEDRGSFIVMCAPSPECGITRIQGLRCTNGNQGAQGLYEPSVCPKGYFCETPAKLEPCPKGFYCPTGTYSPKKCDLFSSCPEGSAKQSSFNGLIICAILDFLVITIYLIVSFKEKKRAEETEKKLKNPFQQELMAGEDNLLVNAFKKSMDGRELKMTFKMKQMSLKLPNGRVILAGVDGIIHAGRMTAIMGPSGAGKTTFMNTLCGKVDRTSGQLFISGKEAEISQFKKIFGFVPQEDVMHRELTVRDNVLHSARIRLPKNWTENEIQNHVDNVLKVLNLAHVAYSPIGDETTRGVSGGQRKRVNIGMEVVATPLCICLDEPTSGLDSTAALETAHMLKDITKLGMTIVAVIHQPRSEIFEIFDDVLMIAPGGKTAYLGPTKDARPYFESIGYEFPDGANEADVLMDILSKKGINPIKSYTPDELVRHWDMRSRNTKGDKFVQRQYSVHESISPDSEFHQYAPVLVQNRGAGFFKQLWFCHNLSLLQQYRTISGVILEVIVGLAAGLLMGLAVSGPEELYSGTFVSPYSLLSSSPKYLPVPQYGLLIGMAVALAASPAGVKVFAEEKPVYWRNASSGHSPLAYFLGKTIASFYRIILAALHFTSILYTLARPVVSFSTQFTMVLLMFFGVYGLSAFVSMVVDRTNANLLAVVIALFASVLNGYGPTLAKAKSWGLFFLWATQFNMWGCEAHWSETLKVFEHVYDSTMSNRPFEYRLDQVAFDFVMMVVIGIVWRIIAFLGMIGLNREKQR